MISIIHCSVKGCTLNHVNCTIAHYRWKKEEEKKTTLNLKS